MEFYVVDLSAIGVKRKVVSIDGYSWEIIHGQKMKKNKVVEVYPQFFKAMGETIGETPKQEVEAAPEIVVTHIPEPVVTESAPAEEAPIVSEETQAPAEETPAEEVVAEEVVGEEVVGEEVVGEEVVGEETQAPAEEAPIVSEDVVAVDADEVLSEASKILTKNELEAFARGYGIELNKQKSLKNMLKELEDKLKA
jgi:hypothetical protein